jgi:hypothetical protein
LFTVFLSLSPEPVNDVSVDGVPYFCWKIEETKLFYAWNEFPFECVETKVGGHTTERWIVRLTAKAYEGRCLLGKPLEVAALFEP